MYLLYLGLMRVMKSPPDKVVGYTVAVVVVAIIRGFVVSVVLASFGFGTGMMPGYTLDEVVSAEEAEGAETI